MKMHMQNIYNDKNKLKYLNTIKLNKSLTKKYFIK